MSRVLTLLLAVWVCVGASGQDGLRSDVAELTRAGHRLAGTTAHLEYLEQRLAAIGVDAVYPLEFPVVSVAAMGGATTLEVDGVSVELLAVRPNVVVGSRLDEPMEGAWVYLGDGALERYAGRSVAGAVVAMEYGCGANWERAFASGAAAVVFLGGADSTATRPKHAPVPLQLPRFFVADADVPAGLDLRKDRAAVRLTPTQRRSVDTQRDAVGRNLIAVIPGEDRRAKEAVVVAVAVDTFGTVPERSPGTRRAANVAGVLALAEAWVKDPPRRDVWLVFHDAGAQRHRGVRHVYDALMMEPAVHAGLIDEHNQEFALYQTGDWRKGFGERSEVSPWLLGVLKSQADAMRADADRKRQQLRRAEGDRQAALEAASVEVAAWDRVRRWLYEGGDAAGLAAEDHDTAEALWDAAQASLLRRYDELKAARHRDAQRTALRDAVAGGGGDPKRVALHVDMDLSDGGARWAPVAGEWTHRLYGLRGAGPTADAVGYHTRVLAGLDGLVAGDEPSRFVHLERRALRDAGLAASFVPGRYVNAGAVAGGYGVYHVAMMTGHDARRRDGHPSDTPANFDFARFSAQFDEAALLLRRLADDTKFSVRASFSPTVVSKYAGWDGRSATGSFVTRRVTGGLSENRPADGAVVALWPGVAGQADAGWRALAQDHPADYQPFDWVPVDSHGRFDVVGLRQDIDAQLMSLATRRDETGRVIGVSTQDTVTQYLGGAMRIDIIDAAGYGLTWWGDSPEQGVAAKLMRASSDAAYRGNLSLVGQGGRQMFWYLANRAAEPGVKVFDADGVTALGVTPNGNGEAAGVGLEEFARPASWAAQSATDVWRLNESRLSKLRSRGVTSPDLEVLHGESGRMVQDGSMSSLRQSTAVSQRVYPQLRRTMDDLVHAVVVLLLLTIPFSFAMERLLIGATSVYGRIAGFTAVFMVTFGVLYATHPGFAVASTPVMIFLAFAIVLLSAVVIWVLVQRFRSELAVLQGRSASAGGEGVGGGTASVMAAIGMGVSTMRRRPTRTTLTAITVVMLTFTILCFASVSREVGVRSVGLGPTAESMPSGAVLVRQLDTEPMGLGVLDTVDAAADVVAESWWRVPSGADDRPITVARPDDGRLVRLGGVMGLAAQTLTAWPTMREAFVSEQQSGSADRAAPWPSGADQSVVYLPPTVVEALGLKANDTVMVDGRPLRFAGPTVPAVLDRLRHVDGESWLPVDVSAQAALRSGAAGNAGASPGAEGETSGSTLRLSAAQVAVVPNPVAQQLGGELRSVTVFVDTGGDAQTVGEALAKVLPTPVWAAGSGGAVRLSFGTTTKVSGVLPLLAPIALGGLIIFGTLLGSISDRQREIYTFSALGLGPKHVGLLFFAEAAVYAAVGGLGGQLLAQVVALGASWAAAWGWIDPVSINFASTQALFAIGVVMATVLISAIYPAVRASRSANPGLARAWVMPAPEPAPHNDVLKLTFPFTVSAYDLTGVVSYLAEHFEQHADAGLGPFAASEVRLGRDQHGRVCLSAAVALAPFDLGVTQQLTLTGVPSDIEGVEEVAVTLRRESGTNGDWQRANRVFLKRLRRRFLVWRTLPTPAVEAYRQRTLEALGEPLTALEPQTNEPGPMPA